jgi:hypothetical protein
VTSGSGRMCGIGRMSLGRFSFETSKVVTSDPTPKQPTEGRVVGICWAKLKPKGPKGPKFQDLPGHYLSHLGGLVGGPARNVVVREEVVRQAGSASRLPRSLSCPKTKEIQTLHPQHGWEDLLVTLGKSGLGRMSGVGRMFLGRVSWKGSKVDVVSDNHEPRPPVRGSRGGVLRDLHV